MISFHYQLALIMLAAPLVILLLHFGNQRREHPLFMVARVVSVPLFGYVGTRIVLHARWLQGIGPYYVPIVGPPSRINCVVWGCGSVILIMMGTAFLLRQHRHRDLAPVLILLGIFSVLCSGCGYLWARSVARSTVGRTEE